MTSLPQTRRPFKLDARVIFFALLVGLIVFLSLFSSFYSKLPWHTGLSGNSFSYLAQSDDGLYFAIDSGSQRLISFYEDGHYRWDTTVGGTDVMRMVVPMADGGALVATYRLDGTNFIEYAAIEQYNASGYHAKTVYSETYEPGGRPLEKSGFIDLRLVGNSLYYVQKYNDSLSMYRIDLSAEPARPERVVHYPMENSDMRVLTAIGVPEAGQICFINKDGTIARIEENGEQAIPYPEQPEAPAFSTPFNLCYQEGTVYVTDIGLRTIMAVTEHLGREVVDLGSGDSMNENPTLYYWIAPAKDGAIALTSRYDMVILDPESGETTVIEPFFIYSAGFRALLWGWWAALVIVALLLLTLIVSMFMRAYRKMGAERLMNSIIMVVVVLVVTALIITQYSSSVNERFTTSTLDTLSGLSKLTASLIDGDGLDQIDAMDDLNTPAYENLRSSLSSAVTSGNTVYAYNLAEADYEQKIEDWDDGVYRVVTKLIGGRLCTVYNNAETYGAIYPLDYGYEGTEYQKLYEEDTQLAFSGIMDYSGIYTYTLTPIHDSTGAVVGVLEMGIDQRAFQEETNALLREIALSVVVAVLVVLLMLKELMFFGQVFTQRVPRGEKRLITVDAVRPLVFLIYLLDCFSLIIKPLFAQSLYSPSMGIPMEIGVALTYTPTFIFLGVAAWAGGRLSSKTGLYPLALVGVVLLLFGEVLASTAQSLWTLVFSRVFVGFGAGLTMNVAETFVAIQPDKKDVQRGFSMYEAALNSGTNCGIIIGTAIGVAFGYPAVYYAATGVGVLVILYLLFIFRKNTMPDVRTEASAKQRGMSFPRFIFSRRIFTFFLFLIVPYLIMNAYIYYFLPLTGTAQGLSEENISRIIFLYGMVVVYLGPILTNTLAGRGGLALKLGIAGLIVAAALALYSFFPVLPVLLAGILMFALADSFFYPGQNIYYSQLPETIRYGAGAALSINNIVSSLAQTVSSYVLAAVIIFGIQQGVAILAGGMVVCMVLFIVFSRSRKGGQVE